MQEKQTTAQRLDAVIQAAIVRGVAANKKQFAELVGIRPELLSRYLSGASVPPASTLARVNSVCGDIFSPDWLLLGTGDMFVQSDGNVNNVQHATVNNGIPPKKFDNEQGWFALVSEKDKQIDRLLTIIERMQQQ